MAVSTRSFRQFGKIFQNQENLVLDRFANFGDQYAPFRADLTFQIREDRFSTRPGLDRPVTADDRDSPIFQVIPDDGGIRVPTNFTAAGQVAIIGVSTEDTIPGGAVEADSVTFILLSAIGSGTVIYFTDRAWNGSAFVAAGGGDSTFTFTAATDMAAGSVITFTALDLSDLGETIYAYQGAINAPTIFLHAVDIADGTNGFEGTELTGTGLVNGTSAVAINDDNAEFGTRTHNIQIPTLFAQINNNPDWVHNDNSPQDGTATGEPAFTAPDRQIWVAGSGAGEAIVTINLDGTYNSGTLGYQIVQAFQNEANLFHPSDITLDTVHDKYFFVDADLNGNNRIIQGSISQLLNNPGQTPIYTVLYSNVGTGAVNSMRTLSIDPATQKIYFDLEQAFVRINYDTAGQTPTVLRDLEPIFGANSYITQMTINYATGTVFLGSSSVMSVFTVDLVDSNRVFMASGLTGSNGANSMTFTEINWGANGDTSIGGEGAPLGNNHWPVERGTIRGVDVNPLTGLLYIVTGSVILDNDGNGATTYRGGVWSYNPANGAVANLYTQNGATGPVGLLYYIEVDPVTGRYYVIDATGGAGNGDGGVWSGSLTTPGTPTFVATVGNFNGLGPHGLEIQSAPTLSGTPLTPTIAETPGNPSPNPSPVTVANAFNTADIDSAGASGLALGDELAGAQVRISGNFQSGGGHADQLLVSTFTSGSNQNGTIVIGGDTVTYSYNATTGVMTFTGITTFDNYENILARVQYRVDGDNPTNYGTAGTRTVSFSTFDGLLYSDEVHATVTVTGVNDAPIIVVPGAQTFNEDTARVFSSANGNALSVSDVDADPAGQALRVTLTVTQGTLTLASLSGLSFVGGAGDGTADAAMIFTGTANAINTALNGLTYNPIADYNGPDTLTFTVSDQGFSGTDAGLTGDGSSEQDSETIALTISPIVDIVTDTIPLTEDAGATNLNLLLNDNFENPGRFISAVGTALHGTVTINDNGTGGILTDDFVVYTAVADYNGSDTFTYTVTSGGVTETIGVTVNISAVADIVPDTVPIGEDAGGIALDLLFNDNFENAGRFISAVGTALHGTVTINNAGTPGDATDDFVIYTATADYNGSDSFTYTVTSGGVTEQATVTVNISAVQDIQADSITVAEDSGANHLNGIANPVSLLANDNFENAGRFISATTQGAHGTTAINDNGTAGDATDDYVIYTVTDGNYVGSDTFTYTVTSGGVTEQATVTVNITAVNDAPVNTVPGTQTINEDGSVTFLGTISITDLDAGAADLTTTLSIADGALTVGTVMAGLVVTGEGTNLVTLTGTIAEINDALNGLTYAPPAHANGSRTLTVTTNDNGNTGTPGALQDVDPITINITALNDTPVVAVAPSASSTEQVAGTIDATATIADIELGALDNYAGSSLNVARLGGAMAQDVLTFGASGAFTVNGANLEAGGQAFATFAGGNGTALVITFTGSPAPATQALVNAVIQSLQYTNTSDNPPASIQLVYTFNDGAPANAGQGLGGSPTGTDTITINITDTPENAAPTLDLDADNSVAAGTGYTAAFTEGGAAVLITDTDVAIADVDVGDMIEGATIAINSAVAGDQLVLGAQLGFTIIGSGTATITITGTGTAAQYQDMLELITFQNTSEDPGASRTINVTVTDGTANSNIAVSTINITQINDEPTLTATGLNPTYTEGDAAADLFSGPIASTIEAGQTFLQLGLTVAGVADGASEILRIDGTDVALTDGNTATTTNSYSVQVIFDIGFSVMAVLISGTLTPAQMQTLVDGLSYRNISENPTDGDRAVNLQFLRDSGSNVSPNDSDATINIVSTVNVNPLNDAPVNGVPTAQTINEDASVTFSSGGGNAITVSDVDIGAGNFTVTLSIADGSLVPVTGGGAVIGGSGTNNVTITGTLAQVNAALEGLVYTPPTDANGSRTLTVTTSDNGNSGGAAQQDVDSVTINITAQNDSPVVAIAATRAAIEQTAVTVDAAATISDIDLDARNGGNGDYGGALMSIQRTGGANAEDLFGLVAGGGFTISGNQLLSGGLEFATFQTVSPGFFRVNFTSAQTAATTALVNDVARALQYTNSSDTPPASVDLIVAVVDGSPGGGQGGGPNGFVGADTITVTIGAVNDAPLTSAPASASGNEDSAIAITGITVSDIDVGGGTLTVTLSIADGALNLVSTAGLTATGVGTNSVSLTGTAADLNASLAGLTYTPPLHANGSRALTIGTSDNGNTGTPGPQTDTDMVSITINSVDDAPQGTSNTVTGSEDDPLIFTLAHFGFSDPNDVPANSFAGIVITDLPNNGTLFLDPDTVGSGAPAMAITVVGTFISATDIGLGRFYFQPVTDAFGNNYDTFDFQVVDSGSNVAPNQNIDPSANTITINITPDNLPPVVDLDGVAPGVNYTTTFVEDGAAVAIGSGVLVSDPDVGLGDLIESATITLTDRVAGDSLTLTGALPPGITAVTTPAVGSITITITGPGTGAQYQALIESIQYATTSQDPTVGGTDPARTITVTVNDGAINSAVATTTVNITTNDDAPTAVADTFVITESQSIVAGNLFANDSDPDGPPLSISAVTGGPGANVGTQFTLDSGALLTVHANGTFDYNPNGIFLPTPTPGSGASNTPSHDSFTYTVAGGNTVTVNITLTGLDTNDLLLGTAGDDIMTAGLGTDQLFGGLGDDLLYGEGGNDSLTGGANNDLIDGGTEIDTAFFGGSLNYVDTLGGWVITSVDGTDFVQNTEIVVDGGGQRNLLVRATGYATLQTALTGAVTGDNVRLATGTYTGTVNYSVGGLTVYAQPGAVQNLTYATVSAFGITVYGAGSPDNITGSGNNDALNGGGGTDVLNGAGGSDYLDGGGTGVAQLNGGSGDDAIIVDGDDLVGEAVGGGFDNVAAKVSYFLNAGAEIEILSTTNHAGTAAINLGGNEFGQVVIGNAGNNYIDGGGGLDVLVGFGGDDALIVDADDQVVEAVGGGYDNVAAKTSYVLNTGAEIEVLSTTDHGGTAAINLTGNEFGQVVIGNAGVNTLDGGLGNDVFLGFGGADTFAFTSALGAGNVDTVLDFVSGTDKIALEDSVFLGLAAGALPAGAFVTGTAALDGDDRIIYDSATGALYYDADGNGAGAQVQFATLSGHPLLVASDFLVI